MYIHGVKQRKTNWHHFWKLTLPSMSILGGGPRVVVSIAAFHARVRGSLPGLGGLKETKNVSSQPRVEVSIVGSLRDREVACSASDRQGSNFESCVWRTVSSQSSHPPQEVLLAQFSLYVHKGGLKPDSFHFISMSILDWNSAQNEFCRTEEPFYMPNMMICLVRQQIVQDSLSRLIR